MLNVLMPQIILNGSGIMPLRREVIAARMPELVGMGHKRPSSITPSRGEEHTMATYEDVLAEILYEVTGRHPYRDGARCLADETPPGKAQDSALARGERTPVISMVESCHHGPAW
jgi:hypothetical protein